MNTDLNIAIGIAAEAHTGQRDKSGAPYIFHPLRVMMSLPSDAERIVGVLHDVLEDCPDWPLDRLRIAIPDPAIIEALEAVTRRPGEDYMDFCRRAGANRIGRAVKIADLRDNLSPARQLAPTPETQERTARYRAALNMLETLV